MDPDLLDTPFYREITEYFLAYNNKDIEKVFEICRNDIGAVDVSNDGTVICIPDGDDWKMWALFEIANMNNVGMFMDTEILDFSGEEHENGTGICFLRYWQFFEDDSSKRRFTCIASVFWRYIESKWRIVHGHAAI